MRFNWIVRLKNPAMWLQMAAVAAAQVLAYFGMTGADFTTWGMVGEYFAKAVQNPYLLVCVAVAVAGIFNDPTTAGLGDSVRAMGYAAPYQEEVE